MTAALQTPIDELKRLYAPPKTPVMVTVPPLSFLAIDGRGDPNTSPEYQDAIKTLYSLSYTLKFALKKECGQDYRVGPLEGLWWADDMTGFGTNPAKDDWSWTMMIAQPDSVTPDRLARVREEVARKKPLAALSRVRLGPFDEGLCAQVLYIGPYSAEGPAIARLHDFIHAQGYHFDGRHQKHHEIYLSDPRRAAPEKWKTIIRQPVAPVDA
jgi:hypothetical protein